MDNKKVAAFSLLAHINDNNIGIKTFEDIYLPIIKSALCKLNSEGKKSGESILEIKEKIDNKFFLDIPIPFLRNLLNSISKEVELSSLYESSNNFFILHKDGSYLMNKFLFADYEEEFEQRLDEIDEISSLYLNYLRSSGLDEDKEPDIFTYIDQNRLNLSKYFAYHEEKYDEQDFIHQANFINSIKKNNRIYEILRRVYLGSLISAYLQVDIGQVQTKVEFLLDTNFLLGVLDLNSVEATHTCRKILDICKRLGYVTSVLPFTLEEAELLIERKAQQLDKAFFQGYLDPESIYNAAKRRNLSKTQLQQISQKLKEILTKEYGIIVVANDEKIRNLAKYQYSEVYEFYRKLRGDNGFSALHDASAVVYVKERRGGKPIKGNILKGSCWFVTNTPHSLRLPDHTGFLPEVIRAEEILNFLWLSNPNVTQLINSAELSSLGLTRLVSSTISNSLPSAKVLRDLDDNFNSYGGALITADDTVMVATMIANKKIKNPEELNKLASKNSDSFIDQVKTYADRGREEEKELKIKIEKLLAGLEIAHQSTLEQKQTEINSISVNLNTVSNEVKYKKLMKILIIVIFIFISFLWWVFDVIFKIKFIEDHSNYYLIKILGQIAIVLLTIGIISKNKTSWISATISAIIATLLLFKD